MIKNEGHSRCYCQKTQPSWHNEEDFLGSARLLQGLRDWKRGKVGQVIWAAGAEVVPAWAQLCLRASRPPQLRGREQNVLRKEKDLVSVTTWVK